MAYNRAKYGKTPDGDTISGSTTINGNIGWKSTPLMIWKEKQVKEAAVEVVKQSFVIASEDIIINFRNNLDEEVKKKSETPPTAGTCLHYLIQCDLEETKPDTAQYEKEIIDKAETGYLNFLEWKSNVRFKVYKTEIELIHRELWYGSTIDCVAWINDKLSLFDWKLAKSLYEDYLIQIESYRHNWDFNFPNEPLKGLHLLKIDNEQGAYTHQYIEQSPDAWEAFLCALKLHQLHKKLKKMV